MYGITYKKHVHILLFLNYLHCDPGKIMVATRGAELI